MLPDVFRAGGVQGGPMAHDTRLFLGCLLVGAGLVPRFINTTTFVAPHLASGEARRGSIAATALCDRGATKPAAKCDATLRAAVLFCPDVVARSLQTPVGYARGSRLVS